MKTKEITVPKVIKELVKNSIDAQSSVIQIEFNETFDVRIKITAEIYIESIKRNSDVRLYKNINVQKSQYKIYKADRGYKDAMVATSHGSMIVLNALSLNIDEANTLKLNIINHLTELALINFEVNISLKDTARQEILFESCSTKNLFEKFELFLQSNQFFSRIQFLSCQKHDIKVELFLCENGVSRKSFQFVYFNRLKEHDKKWTKTINNLCSRKFENDLNTKFPVYFMNIHAANYRDNKLANNVIIENCIRKCVEQVSKPQSKSNAAKNDTSQKIDHNNEIQIRNEVPLVNATNNKDNEHHGIRLGDWIFNNSCENYEILNQGRETYRNKICENWVTSLSKPKPKVDDSLANVEINKTHHDDNLFKIPAPPTPRKIKKSRHPKGKISKIKPSTHVSTQIYKPSQNVKAFNNSNLMRTSRKLVSSRDKSLGPAKKNRSNKGVLETPKSIRNLQDQDINALPAVSPIVSPIQDVRFENPNESIGHIRDNFNPPSMSPSHGNESNDRVKIYKSTKKTLDFKLHKNDIGTNFNMNFSSSIAIQTVNDPFMGFFESNVAEITSMSHLFENNVPAGNCLPLSTSNTEFSRHCGSTVYSETSQHHYHGNRNNSIRTHYRQQTYCNLNRSVSNPDHNERQSKSIRSSSHSQTTIAQTGKTQSSPTSMLNDHARQNGWPVTININFGRTK